MDSYTFEEKSPPPPNNPPNTSDMSIASSDHSETLLLSQHQHHPQQPPLHHPLPNIYIPTAPPVPPPYFPSEVPTGEPTTQRISFNNIPQTQHLDDDDMLQSVTDNTDYLSINEASQQSSQNPAPNKRGRPTTDTPHHHPPPPSTIRFSTDIHIDPATILSSLTQKKPICISSVF